MSGITEYLIAFVAIVLIPSYYYYTKLHKIKKFVKRFPTPPTKPFIGNAGEIRTNSEFLQYLHKCTKEYGSMFHLQFGPLRNVLVTTDYKFLEFLLSHNKLLRKGANMRFLEPWLGTGLITADGGRKWRTHRKLITPAFHFKILEQFVDIFEADGDILVEKMAQESGQKSVNIYPYITRCTFDAICETAMGTKVDVQNNEVSEYFQAVKEMCRIFVVRTTAILQRNDFLHSFTKDYSIQEKSLNILHGYTRGVIKNKREELKEKRPDQNDAVDELGRKKKKVFLDLILEARVNNQSLSDEEIREEVDNFMFAGHDTTATACSFILYCIAGHKEVQDKIIKEQEELFGNDKNPKITYTKLQEMKYLENVVKESLRLYSAVPIIGREITEEVEYDGQIFPKGLGVLIFIYGVHMNPEYYPNPEKFDPSRFENLEKKLPFAFIPFSAGPRNCIGQKFAMLEIKSIVSKIVRNFELFPASPRHDMMLSAETVLQSLNGVKIGLKLR